jgi:hypothetical protein
MEPDTARHGLRVEEVPRPDGEPYFSVDNGLSSTLPDLTAVPLDGANPGADAALERTLRRIVPTDGSRVLLVAASFNSAI